jgi:hypothetical protein
MSIRCDKSIQHQGDIAAATSRLVLLHLYRNLVITLFVVCNEDLWLTLIEENLRKFIEI